MLSTRSASPGTRMDSVEDALAALREGRTVIVVDDESRENEGDLILPAQLSLIHISEPTRQVR